MKKLVFATNNKHKLKEAKDIIGNQFEIISLEELGFKGDIVEDADTIEGNAKIKADFITRMYGVDCFADDTGLEVDALSGAPGVYSARYAGEHCSFQDNVKKLLAAMDGIENRKADFRTTIALNLDGKQYLFDGRVDGTIATEQHGEGGFGYDPVFVPEGHTETFSEMGEEAKNVISHRGRALQKLISFLSTINQ